MVYGQDACTKKKIIKGSISWVFALSMGLVVSISDVNLTAETGTDRRSVSQSSDRGISFLHEVYADNREPRITELSDSMFVPVGEPEVLPFDRVIHEAAGRHDVDADLILAVVMVESRFNPKAKSKKGAMGLMQLMPDTADALDVDDILSPEENVDAGTRHLRWLLTRFDGDIKLALAAYNAGMQNIVRYDGIPPFQETRAYVTKVLENYAALKQDTLRF